MPTKEQIVESWENTGILKGVPEDIKSDLALLLETQRIYNEVMLKDEEFARLSIPLIYRTNLLGDPALNRIASIHPLTDPEQKCEYRDRDGQLKEQPIEIPPPRTLKTIYSHENELSKDVKALLDFEAELTVVLAQSIRLEHFQEIITDIEKAAVVTNEPVDTILQACGYSPNFVVTSPDIAKERWGLDVKATFEPSVTEHLVDGCTLIQSPLAKSVVWGFRSLEDRLFAGYHYLPYMSLIGTMPVADPETNSLRHGFMSKYAKTFIPGGEGFYAVSK